MSGRGLSFAACALIIGTVLAGCGGSDGTNYTAISGSRASCDQRNMIVGDTIEPILSVHNSSGHDWASTWLWGPGRQRLPYREHVDEQSARR